MKIVYKTWLRGYNELNTEKGSVGIWDLWNKTKFKSKVEKGQLTSAAVAEENHANGRGYEFCAFDAEHQEYPFAYVNTFPKSKHIGVEFLDFAGRKYLHYLFGQSKREEDKCFLREIWYYHFTSETAEEEDYRIHFVFYEEGNINYRKYDEKEQKIQDYESKEPMDVSCLYEDYPAFGDYEKILQVERPCFTETFNTLF